MVMLMHVVTYSADQIAGKVPANSMSTRRMQFLSVEPFPSVEIRHVVFTGPSSYSHPDMGG